MDEFKGFIREKVASADVSNNAFFTDTNGNWACTYHISDGSWQVRNYNLDIEDGEIAIYEEYYYYDRSDNKLHKNEQVFATTIDEQALTWEIDEAETQTYSATGLLLDWQYYDFDKGGPSEKLAIAQTLLNNDDKYEFFITEPNNFPVDSYEAAINVSFPQYGENFNACVKLSKTEYDNQYKPYTYFDLIATNEDGNELFRINNVYGSSSYEYGDGSIFTIFRSEGKTYILCQVYSFKYDEDKKKEATYVENVIYLINNQNGTGVTEVSRTRPSKIEKAFNTAGMQVAPDSKGIIITDNGLKYINK